MSNAQQAARTFVYACGIAPFSKFAGTLKKHWTGILNYFTSRATNAIAEGINSLIRTTQGIARGFANKDHLRLMVYLKQGLV